jgi:hypothetical protein
MSPCLICFRETVVPVLSNTHSNQATILFRPNADAVRCSAFLFGLKPILAFLFLVVLAPLTVSASPADDEELETIIGELVERYNSGNLSVDELISQITKRKDLTTSSIHLLKELDIDDVKTRKAIANRLIKDVEEILINQSSVNAGMLRKVARAILGEDSPEYTQILSLFNTVDQTEHFVATDNLAGLVSLRERTKSPAEERVLEVKITRFLTVSAEDNIEQHRPEFALRQLAQIRPDWRTKNTIELAARAIVSIERILSQSPAELKLADLFDEPGINNLIAAVQTDPGVSIALASIFSERTLDSMKRGLVDKLQSDFDKVLRFRPDPNPENDRLRLELAFFVSNADTRAFATERIKEMNISGRLGLLDKLRLLLSGYASIELKVLIVLLVTLLVALLVFWLAAKNAPALAGILRRRRSNKGYMRSLDEAPVDEYSRLLAMFGLDDTATGDEIKKTYRQMIKDYHPDSAEAQDEETVKQFIQLREAYERIQQIRSSWFR